MLWIQEPLVPDIYDLNRTIHKNWSWTQAFKKSTEEKQNAILFDHIPD